MLACRLFGLSLIAAFFAIATEANAEEMTVKQALELSKMTGKPLLVVQDSQKVVKST